MARQYLTFKLAETIYAVNVFQVREVLSYISPQPLPNPDPVIEGLIRSRGQSISVVNLRRRFGLPDARPDGSARIIVLELESDASEGEQRVLGAVADSVNEVLELDDIDCEVPPELGNSRSSRFISGIGRQDNKFIIVLNIDKIFDFSEIAEFMDMSRTACPEEAEICGADIEETAVKENNAAQSGGDDTKKRIRRKKV